MNIVDRIHCLHRFWRQRLRGDKFGIAHMRSLDLHGATAIDVGANRGIYSYWLNKLVGPMGRVFSFEPQPELVSGLHKITKAFGLKQVEVVGSGVSSQSGKLTLVRPRNHWGGASFEISQTDDRDAFEVPVISLDEFFADRDYPPIKFIKCDVQDHESQVFRGAERILRESRPDILVEITNAYDTDCEPIGVLEEFGYDGFCFYGGGLFPIRRYNEVRSKLHKKAVWDFAFIPRERAGAIRKSRAA